MEKPTKRKFFRRRYKHLAAAMAGAALITGVALPGIPVAKAAAAERHSPNAPNTEQTAQLDRDHDKHRPSPRDGWHEHKYSWPGPDENQGWYQDGRIYYRSDRYNNDYDDYAYLSSPVDIVRNHASQYGFDRNRDTFTLISLSRYKAVVGVVKHDTGQRFEVGLERDRGDDWSIIFVRT